MTPDHPEPLAIHLEQLRFSYAKADSPPVLDIPEWRVPEGSRVFLQGPSGAGKSTLLHLLSGLLLADHGRAQVLGTDLAELSGSARDHFRGQRIGLIGQVFNLVPYLSVRDNLQLAGYFAGRKPEPEQLRQALADLQLDSSLLDRRADRLSIGQQQRVAIARALLKQPALVIADEPTSALDRDAQSAFMDLLLGQCQQQGSTLVFVSHDSSLAAQFDQHIQLGCLNRAAAGSVSC